MKSDNTGVYVVFGIAIVALAGVWAYNEYVKPKVDTITKTTIFFGLF